MLTNIQITLSFETNDGFRYEMYHSQYCCESVYIESIVEDVNDLLNTPILRAEEVESNDNPLSKYEKKDSLGHSINLLQLKAM